MKQELINNMVQFLMDLELKATIEVLNLEMAGSPAFSFEDKPKAMVDNLSDLITQKNVKLGEYENLANLLRKHKIEMDERHASNLELENSGSRIENKRATNINKANINSQDFIESEMAKQDNVDFSFTNNPNMGSKMSFGNPSSKKQLSNKNLVPGFFGMIKPSSPQKEADKRESGGFNIFKQSVKEKKAFTPIYVNDCMLISHNQVQSKGKRNRRIHSQISS